MNPILVPTLAELRVELDRAEGIRAAIAAKMDDQPETDELTAKRDQAEAACFSLLNQIAAISAASLADLRVKAHAFNWSARLLDDEPYRNPTDGEVQIMRQLVIGLLDERIA